VVLTCETSQESTLQGGKSDSHIMVSIGARVVACRAVKKRVIPVGRSICCIRLIQSARALCNMGAEVHINFGVLPFKKKRKKETSSVHDQYVVPTSMGYFIPFLRARTVSLVRLMSELRQRKRSVVVTQHALLMALRTSLRLCDML
jgi:hypothetical protein